MEGLIIKNISNDYLVKVGNQKYVCKPRGKFRNKNITPLVGDRVIIDADNNYILDILERKNSLVRPSVANIDQALIVTSVKSPDFSTNLLDKLLTIIVHNKIKPIICFTKLDKLNDNELKEINKYIDYYKNLFDVYVNTEIEDIKKIFKNKITVFTGQSGAGKSTLLNNLDITLNLKTNEISHALGRGKHTTRHVELISMYDGLVADTPGFSSIDFNDMTNEDIKNAFIEFNNYNCEYKDCMHNKEKVCLVKDAVSNNEIISSRYENYIKFINRGD